MQDDKTTAVTEEKVKPKRPVRAYEDELKRDNEDYLKGLQDEMKDETKSEAKGRIGGTFAGIKKIAFEVPFVRGFIKEYQEYEDETKKQKQAVDELKASLGTSTSLNAIDESYKDAMKDKLKKGEVPGVSEVSNVKYKLTADLICEHGGSKKEREALNNFSKDNTAPMVARATDILNAMDESPYKSMKKDMIMGDKVLKQASQCPHAAASIKHMGENLGSMNRSSAVFIQVLETATKAQDVDAAKARIDFLKENFTSIGGAVDRAALKSFADKFDKEPNFKIDIHDKGQRADFAASMVGKYPKIYDAMKEAYAGKDGEGKMSNRELAVAVAKMVGNEKDTLANIEKGLENEKVNKAFREGLKSSMTKEAGVKIPDVEEAAKRFNKAIADNKELDKKQQTVPAAALSGEYGKAEFVEQAKPKAVDPTEIYSTSRELLDAQSRNSMSQPAQEYTNIPHIPNQPAGAGVNAQTNAQVVDGYGFIPDVKAASASSEYANPIQAAGLANAMRSSSSEYGNVSLPVEVINSRGEKVVLPPPPPPMQADSPAAQAAREAIGGVVTGNPPAYDPKQGPMRESSHQTPPSPDSAKAAGHGASIAASK